MSEHPIDEHYLVGWNDHTAVTSSLREAIIVLRDQMVAIEAGACPQCDGLGTHEPDCPRRGGERDRAARHLMAAGQVNAQAFSIRLSVGEYVLWCRRCTCQDGNVGAP